MSWCHYLQSQVNTRYEYNRRTVDLASTYSTLAHCDNSRFDDNTPALPSYLLPALYVFALELSKHQNGSDFKMVDFSLS